MGEEEKDGAVLAAAMASEAASAHVAAASGSPSAAPVTFTFGSMAPAAAFAAPAAPAAPAAVSFESFAPAKSDKFNGSPNIKSKKTSEDLQLTAEEQLVLSLCACLRAKKGYDVPWFSLNAHPSFAQARMAMSKRRWTWKDDVALVTYVDKLAQALDTPW